MKSLALSLMAISFVGASAQQPATAKTPVPAPENRARVFVTDSDSWESTSASGGGFGGFSGGFGSSTRAGARPQTAEVIKTIGQRCPELIVNNRPEASDYIVRLEHEGGKGLLRKKDKVAVFVRTSGDSIFSDSTLSVGGAVQGACAAADKHWSANAAALAARPAPTTAPGVPVPMASLVVEASVAGAEIEVDGEFMGNAPSTLSVVPGRHTITVKRKGYADWSRSMTLSGSNVHLNAELAATTGS